MFPGLFCISLAPTENPCPQTKLGSEGLDKGIWVW